VSCRYSPARVFATLHIYVGRAARPRSCVAEIEAAALPGFEVSDFFDTVIAQG
jgi:hypothetical protein